MYTRTSRVTKGTEYGEIVEVHVLKTKYNIDYTYLYFIPNNGIRIENIRTITNHWTNEPDRGWVKSDTSPSYVTKNVSSSDVKWDNLEEGVPLGGIQVGYSYFDSEAGTYYENEQKRDDIDIEINCVSDQLKVEIIESPSSPSHEIKLLYFQYGSGENIGSCLFRKTEEEHSYTNIVAFDGDYELDGQGMPDYIDTGWYWSRTTTAENHCSTTEGAFGHLAEDERKTDSLVVDYSNLSNHVAKKILVYSDMFFLVFSAHDGTWVTKEDKKEVARVGRQYLLRTTFLLNGEVSGNSMDIAMANLRLPGENGEAGKFLYADSSHYLDKHKEKEEVWDPEGVEGGSDETPPTEEPLQMIGENDNEIPSPHRWITHTGGRNRNNEHISKYWNYVVLVDSNDPPQIADLVSAYSDYARFTGYWEVYNWDGQANGADRKTMLVKDDEVFPIKRVRNMFLQPVWKPYSEVDLVVYQGTVDGQTVFDKKEYQYFTSRLKKNFESEDGVCRRKKFFIDATKNSDDNEYIKTLERYAKTPSPFKCEIWCTKGNRLEYDAGGGNVIGNGVTTLAVSKNSAITPEMFKKLHDTSNYWWEDYSLFLYIASGFGAGIQQGSSSASQGTALPSAEDLAPGINNLFYIVGCCATTSSAGVEDDGIVCGPEFMLLKKCMRKSKTYQGICQSFTSLVSNLTTKTYMLIDKFFDDTYDVMQKVVKSSQDYFWDNSKPLIKNDILTNGKKYFLLNDYVPEDTANYAASDNFFAFEDGRKWRIHDGFVGYVKQHVFPAVVCDERKSNQIEYFTDSQLVALGKEFPKISENTRRLRIDVSQVFSNSEIHYDYRFLAITHPRCECFGAFANDDAEFMNEPSEFYRNWLSSDNDIVQLKEKYMQRANA